MIEVITAISLIFIIGIMAIIVDVCDNKQRKRKEKALADLENILIHSIINPMLPDLFKEDNIPFKDLTSIDMSYVPLPTSIEFRLDVSYKLHNRTYHYVKKYTYYHISKEYELLTKISNMGLIGKFITYSDSSSKKYIISKIKEHMNSTDSTYGDSYIDQIY